MAFDKYFKHVPNFDYVSRLPNRKYINDYVQTKNLFKRVKLSDEIFGDLNFFSKTIIETGERPDNIAYRVYDDESLDWLVLLSNNIINFESEWPLDQISFDNYIMNKYGSYENMYNIHHYETKQILDGNNNTILKGGLEVPQNYSFTYYDTASDVEMIANNVTDGITNIQYEERIQEDKQSIYILKPRYLSVILNEINTLMPYKEGCTQFVGNSLVKGDNIRLYT